MILTLLSMLLAIASALRPQIVLVAALALHGELLAALIAGLAAVALPWRPPEGYVDRAIASKAGVKREIVYSPIMSLGDARRVLGVGPDASSGDIKMAHRRLIERVHPDKGGSEALAVIVNEARAMALNGSGDGRSA